MNEPLTSRPRTLKEIATYYNVDVKTVKNWLSCDTLKDVQPEKGRYYSIRQLKRIIEHLGEA
ncbi:MAG: hypothetical protein IJU33_02220 [Bacteroidales bacterium]|nr:hypothetical protein [Bacteroidales bacterium]